MHQFKCVPSKIIISITSGVQTGVLINWLLGEKRALFVAFVDFCGLDPSTLIDFKLPMDEQSCLQNSCIFNNWFLQASTRQVQQINVYTTFWKDFVRDIC